ncbi:hypothetical protein SBV1_3160005 [Verrucomicrobia bacterium]|nr:hypothetical protein SBV1_3160005 [Verrucomicrobiota bacterium]
MILETTRIVNCRTDPARDPIKERGSLNLSGFVRNRPVDFRDAFGLAAADSQYCQELKQKIDSLNVHPRDPWEDYELGLLLEEYAMNCTDNPPPPPVTEPCPIPVVTKPPPHSNNSGSFCSNHPWACGGIAVGIGVVVGVVGCTVCPECCVIGIGIGAPVAL